MTTLQYALSAFVVLVVTVGPLSTAAIFAGMTARASRDAPPRIALQGVAIATIVLVLFGLVGEKLLGLLHMFLRSPRRGKSKRLQRPFVADIQLCRSPRV